MKKILLFVISILMICGCGRQGNVEKGNNVEELSLYGVPTINEYIHGGDGYRKYDIVCDELKDIIDISGNYFLTPYGLYEINYLQKFSVSNSNCRLINNDREYKRIVEDDAIYVLSNDNKVYEYNYEGNFVLNNSFIPSKYVSKLDNIHISKKDVDERWDNINSRLNFFLYEDGKVYYLGDNWDKKEEVFTLSEGETIISFMGGFIKTDKKYYSFYEKIINEKECNEYADIECIGDKRFHEDGINKYYDRIKFYKSPLVIDRDNNVYACGQEA